MNSFTLIKSQDSGQNYVKKKHKLKGEKLIVLWLSSAFFIACMVVHLTKRSSKQNNVRLLTCIEFFCKLIMVAANSFMCYNG